MSVPLGHVEITIGVNFVAKRSTRQPRHPPYVPGRKGNHETIGRGVGQSVHGICPKVVILALFAIGDDRGARVLKLLNRVPYGFLVKRIQRGIGKIPGFGDRFHQAHRSGNAANGLGRNFHGNKSFSDL